MKSFISPGSTRKGKNKKSQAVVKEERKQKDKLRQQEQADNDETSSTTTESSSAEVEEKVKSYCIDKTKCCRPTSGLEKISVKRCKNISFRKPCEN